MSSEKLELNVKFEPLEGAELDALTPSFPSYTYGVVRGTPGGFQLSPAYAERAEDIYNFEVKEDDIWVVTFPKCGTTWTQDMVWLVANDCDCETAKSIPLEKRFPFLEMSLLMPKELMGPPKDDNESADQHGKDTYDFMMPFDAVASLPSPRFIKSHLPFYLLPPNLLDKAKVVYVARNPKDVIVSFYHHHRLFKAMDIPIDVEKFADHFIQDQVNYSPYFPHILEAWQKRNHPNILFLFYEDMKADLAGQLQKIANFLGKPMTEENLEKLVDHLRFDNFAKNPSVNMEHGKKLGIANQEGNFIRKGKTGDWKNHFSPELNSRIDAWIEKNLAQSDLKFVTELDKQD